MNTTNLAYVGQPAHVAVAMDERYKYEQMWKHDAYRAVAPGENIAMEFLQQAKPKAESTVIDYGAGTGRGALMLALLGNMKVHMLDFASNCLDEDVRNALTTQAHVLSFSQHDLTKSVNISAQYGYCTDVMEHIPPHQVDQVLANVLRSSEHVFFQISCEDDVCGALIGQPLHLSVHDYKWWLAKLQQFDCAVHWSKDCGSHCLFYVTAWQSGKEFVDCGILNIAEQQIIENVKINIAGEWKQAFPHAVNEDVEVAILCGGPSLNDYVDEIKAFKANGGKLITLNGAYNWAHEHGLFPVTQVMVDARPFNARFVHPIDERNIYLMASQVDPSVLQDLPLERTYLWHTNMALIKDLLNERYDLWFNTPGGSTVALRAIFLLRMLGYKRMTMYGFDSCLMENAHHSYMQIENDDALVVPVTCGDRMFKCHPWMCSQATEFMDLIKVFGDEIELNVKGDGLIAHILNTGANMADNENSSSP